MMERYGDPSDWIIQEDSTYEVRKTLHELGNGYLLTPPNSEPPRKQVQQNRTLIKILDYRSVFLNVKDKRTGKIYLDFREVKSKVPNQYYVSGVTHRGINMIHSEICHQLPDRLTFYDKIWKDFENYDIVLKSF